jgi:hypothetical protein
MDAAHVDDGAKHKLARRIHLDGDLLESQRRLLLATERQHVDSCARTVGAEREPGMELTGGEVVALPFEGRLLR